MSKMIHYRIPHGEIDTYFKDAVRKKYGNQLGTLGLEIENAMISKLIEWEYGDFKDSEFNKPTSKDSSEKKSVFIFSEPVFANKNRRKLYEFLKQHDVGSRVNFSAIKHFVQIRLGKTGRRTAHEYADAMVESEVIEPIQFTSKGNSAYKQYRILIGISEDHSSLDKISASIRGDIF